MATSLNSLGRDRGLEVRIVVTLALLGLVYAVLGVALLAAGTGVVAMALLMAGLAFAQLYFSDKLALRSVGARVATVAEAPELHGIVERLCVAADLPKPRLAIADVSLPNAFVVGRSRTSATICVTSGLLETLDGPQLEAVLAHELAHVKHHDVMVITVASFFASVAALITQVGIFSGGLGGRDREQLPFQLVLAISFAVYLVSYFLMLALSRYREFAADRGAALFTGRPTALAAALMHISTAASKAPQTDLRAMARMNAFFIVPVGTGRALRTLLSTHPPVAARVARLLDLEAQLHAAAPLAVARDVA
jgi:heat shock protein HtpX